MATGEYHIPVLLRETIHALSVIPGGVYVDCTFGGGGHAKAILGQLNKNGKLIAFDQDIDAQKNKPEDARFLLIHQNFRHVRRYLRLNHIEKVNGVLADLGVSSHLFDDAQRGFSTRFDATLDMRMDHRQPFTARDVLNNYSGQELQRMFGQYGNVSNAKTLAATIVKARSNAPLSTISQFKHVIRGTVKGNPHKYLAQAFQAIRMEVNDEPGALKELLGQLSSIVTRGGRVAVITFHSFEDKLVKRFFRDGSFEDQPVVPFIQEERKKDWKLITKKPVQPAADEIKKNPRARSAKLRVAEKI